MTPGIDYEQRESPKWTKDSSRRAMHGRGCAHPAQTNCKVACSSLNALEEERKEER